MYSVAPLAKAASDSGTGSRPFLVRGNAHASLDGKGWLLSVFFCSMICVCSYIVIDLHFGANMKKVLSICFFFKFFLRKSTLRTT